MRRARTAAASARRGTLREFAHRFRQAAGDDRLRRMLQAVADEAPVDAVAPVLGDLRDFLVHEAGGHRFLEIEPDLAQVDDLAAVLARPQAAGATDHEDLLTGGARERPQLA